MFTQTAVYYVLQPNRREVGEIRERTDGRKLRNLEVDLDFAAGKLVRERIERKEAHLGAWSGLNVETLLVDHAPPILTDPACG